MSREARAIVRRIGTRTVVLRRGATALAAQPGVVALASRGAGQASERRGEASRSQQNRAELWGLPTLDVQVGDRLTEGGVAFRVVFVRPDRVAATVADLETE
ncbi:MAG: hypothetical protein WCG26_09960 [Chloroflexales bacterium]